MKIEDIVLKLNNESVVDKIKMKIDNAYHNSKVYIAASNIESQKDTIYFILDTMTEMSLDNIGELAASIQKTLGCNITDEEDNIFVEDKNSFKPSAFNSLFKNVTEFSKENFSDVKSFLEKNYLAQEEKKLVSNFNSNLPTMFNIKDKKIDRQVLTNISNILKQSSPEEADEILEEMVQKLSPEHQASLLKILNDKLTPRNEPTETLFGH